MNGNFMRDGSCRIDSVASYYDFKNICPKSPLELISNAYIGESEGELAFSTTWYEPGVAWGEAYPLVHIATAPLVEALGTDDKQKVADAVQWNFTRMTWDGDTGVPWPLQRMIFLRAGREWLNRITFEVVGDSLENLELGLLYNTATRGDSQGTVPVIAFPDYTAGTGTFTLDVVLIKPGLFRMGLFFTCLGTKYLYDMEWFVVP